METEREAEVESAPQAAASAKEVGPFPVLVGEVAAFLLAWVVGPGVGVGSEAELFGRAAVMARAT